MKVAELRKYRDNAEAIQAYERQLEKIEEKLEKKKVTISVEGSRGYPSYEKTTCLMSGTMPGSDTVQLEDKKRNLINMQNQLFKEQEEIEEFICAVPKERIHKALYHYCINKDLIMPTWSDVADIMREADYDALRMAVKRFLKKY